MIKFYNTLSRKKEEFIPLQKDTVKIYSCGPTVYSFQHIGNLRAALCWDFLKRTLRYFNFKVIDVMNITDVGHLVSDEDAGEDKMLKAAKKENKDPFEIARFYEDVYKQDLNKLNIIPPTYMPRATDHIKEQIQIIQELEKGGFTYKTSDGIYFDVEKFKDYGKLSGQSLEQKKAGARVQVDSEKHNPQDFALWKFLTKENENHIMKWDSPWGQGFPGWHIECSAMSHKYLGSQFDIHTGGIEHIPVHHENEIAQNTCSHEVDKINFWMHNNHMLVDGEKMSKSLGNTYTIADLEKRGFDPLALREICLRSHYRKQINFTFESLEAGVANVKKINDFVARLNNMIASPDVKDELAKTYKKRLDEFENGLKDDLNTPIAVAAVYEFINDVNKKKILSEKDKEMAIEFMQRVDKVLGLIKQNEIPAEIIELAQKRLKARADKNWEESDKLRDEITLKGYEIKDSKEAKVGYILSKI